MTACKTVCILAIGLMFPVGECVPLSTQNHHNVYEIDFDHELQQPGVHHREPRRTGRGSSIDTWACENITALPDDIRAEFPLDVFYQKYTHAYGIPIISSNVSQDEALTRACYTVRFLLADRKDIRDAMFDQYGRVGVIALTEQTTEIPEHRYLSNAYDERARGLGGIPNVPITTDGEENLLCADFTGDRWFEEDVLIHEFAHAIHFISLNRINSSFQPNLSTIYNMAKADNLWSNTYAISKYSEYFAEGVQSFFEVNTCRSFVDNVHNSICTRNALMSYDQRLYDLICDIFPCKNAVVDRCVRDQGRAASQLLKMNCDVSVTTMDTSTDATTESSTEGSTTSTTIISTTSSTTNAENITYTVSSATTIAGTACDNSPCENDGECIPLSNDGFWCNCSSIWTGKTCEYHVNKCKLTAAIEKCTAKGLICKNQLDGYTCECQVGYFLNENLDKCEEGRLFRMTMVIVKYQSSPAKFTTALTNSSSVEFLTHQKSLQDEFRRAFSALNGFRNAAVLFFFNGSIGVEAAVTYAPTSTVTRADMQHIIATENPFVGSEYKFDPSNSRVTEEVCEKGYCHNGGTCAVSSVNYLSSCICPSGYDGDRCSSKTSTGQLNPTVIVICLIAAVGGIIVLAIVIQRCRVQRRQRSKRIDSANAVELKCARFSQVLE